MKKLIATILFIYCVIFAACEKEDPVDTEPDKKCTSDNALDIIETRDFLMGFTTWPYGPDVEDVAATDTFIKNYGDIYTEHIDDKIPWDAWINDTPLPQKFVDDISFKAGRKTFPMKRMVSVSLLNNLRTDLAEDLDGSTPTYTALNDQTIEDAYFKHLSYVIDELEPDYIALAIEVNDLYKNDPQKWDEYKLLMANIRSRIRTAYPTLTITESLTLHNWYNPDVTNPQDFIDEINSYTTNLDFVSISFYPFFKGQHTKAEFQLAFDFLHSAVSKPIAFVETTHLAEDLLVEGLSLDIKSDVCEQKDYLETLLLNAHQQNYLFVTWWAHRDFDELWKTFPENLKDLGKLWRDTGLLNESGAKRPAYKVWKTILNK